MIGWEPTVLASGLGFPEGPVLLGPDDVAFVEISGQRVSRARDGGVELIAALDGGPNGAALGPDGALYVANNGGLNVGPHGYWFAEPQVGGSVQRVTLDGDVSTIATGFDAPEPHRPNDLAFGPDGALYVTDPHNWEDLANLGPGRVWRVTLDGDVERVTDAPNFVNGIAFDRDGRLLAARSIEMAIFAHIDGSWVEHARMPAGFPDGICLAADGRLIACGSMGHVIVLFSPGGEVEQVVETGEETEPTNCCLGDGVLYVTLSGVGELVRVPCDAEPLPLYPHR